MSTACLTVDLGSSSGRVMAATYADGHVELKEVHRFVHGMEEQDGYLCWNTTTIWEETCTGIKKGLAFLGLPADQVTLSVDTWGVDYAYLDAEGRLLGPARTYRDARTTRTAEAFNRLVSPEQVWEYTGIQPATINTANQLFAQLQEEPELASNIATVLPLPDWVVYSLTGKISYAQSIASTTGLATPGATEWSKPVFEALGIPAGWFSKEPKQEGTIVGQVIDGLGFDGLTVVHGGAHDTACAVTAVPAQPEAVTAFVSCGSWAVLGIVGDDPILAKQAFTSGLTNEVCVNGQIRTLCNLTGLWILQQCQAQWQDEGLTSKITDLIALTETTPSQGFIIDVQDERYQAPRAMADEICADIASRYNVSHLSQGQIVRIILESLASAIGLVIAELSSLAPHPLDTVHVMGGGSHNTLLCQMIANATGQTVIAGPHEASAFGAVLAQLIAVEAISPADTTSIVAASNDLKRYDPAPGLLVNQMKALQDLRS